MTKINFITSNKGKIKALETSFALFGVNADVVAQNLDIVEPQLDNVADVSRHKALEAFKILGEPVLVEDGGMCVEALNGFPGVYTKYAQTTIGAEGIVKLMVGKENRNAKFVSVATYINDKGEIFQFEREGGEWLVPEKVVDVTSPFAWSEFWKIIYFKEYNKTLAEFSKEELDVYFNESGKNGSIQKFAKWCIANI
ncbi:MAG: non-canonical purine NTP pyrophosphatase [Alphaproteobacteria bacterium]